jgi:hypothetical protein
LTRRKTPGAVDASSAKKRSSAATPAMMGTDLLISSRVCVEEGIDAPLLNRVLDLFAQSRFEGIVNDILESESIVASTGQEAQERHPRR